MRFSRLCLMMALPAALYSGAALAKTTWYVGAAAGNARISYNGDVGAVHNYVLDRRFTYALEFGFRPSRYLGVEAAYHEYGHYNNDVSGVSRRPGVAPTSFHERISNRIEGWTFLLEPQLPLGHGVVPFLEVGLLHWHMSGLTGASINRDASGNRAAYGFGVRYDFRRHLSLKLGYHYSNLQLNESSLAAEWRF